MAFSFDHPVSDTESSNCGISPLCNDDGDDDDDDRDSDDLKLLQSMSSVWGSEVICPSTLNA